MNISCNIEVTNFGADFADSNNYNDFKNSVKLDFLPTFNDSFKCEIALTHISIVRVDIPKLLKKNQDILRKAEIGLLRVCLPNSGLDSLIETCVCDLSTDFLAGKNIENLIYHTINLKHDNVFYVQLRDENNDLINLPVEENTLPNYNYSVVCLFHIRTMSLFDTKFLTLVSNSEQDKLKYDFNTPINFAKSIPISFHDNEDFTGWEVALESVFVSHALMHYFRSATVVRVSSGKIPFFDTRSNANDCTLRCYVPKYSRNRSMIHLTSSNLIYFPITKRLLDEISIELLFINGVNRLELEENDINDNMFVRVNLLFRRKLT
jgi:hypothetical protein